MSSVGPSRTVWDVVSRSTLAEAAGYVGTAVALAATALVVERNPPGTSGRLLVVGVVVAILFGVGAATGEGSPGTARLRSVMWFATVLGWLMFVGLLVLDVLDLDSRAGAILASALAAAGAVAVWWICRRALQEILAFVTLGGLLVALIMPTPTLFGALDTSTIGVLLWLFGAAWFVAAAAGRLRPRRTGMVLGAVTALLAPLYLLQQEGLAGDVLTLATALALLVVGARLADRAVEGLAIVALLLEPGAIVFEHLVEPTALSVVALVVGLVLLGASVALARSQAATGAPGAPPPSGPAPGAPSPAGPAPAGSDVGADVPPPQGPAA